MRSLDIVTNLPVADVETAKDFYADFLGMNVERFNLGWVVSLQSPDTGARVQLVAGDATAAEDSIVSIHTDDVDAAHDEARERGYEIVHPLVDEAWGVRRFFVRAPDGAVINIVGHPA